MANIVRRDPFAIDDLFDDLMRGFFVRPMHYPSEVQALGHVKIDVKEDDKSYTVHADLPGVKKEDIHVNIEGNTVAINAEVKRESEQKEGEKVLHSERYYGKVYRSFTLGHDIDEAAAKAKFENGVLDLTLPKKTTGAAKRLTID
ncbi:heat shock protein Hsp20 [Sulfuritortus calidifontis]|uniref:Heat shock protein Hsp20 n=1 Tax=Sulfuritortus calidifontis TaxID=1914471 RepID=A0A4R3JVR2_9PROT|nr:Hsp20/alpha crystallin family protein [Sulfuritortus calidifontis]TCS72181.1 heat shock protein Hsp20 [Sulfuritortus calidifontis]